MGNPIQTIPNLPPAIAVSGDEQFWINQAGVDRRTTLSAIVGLVPPPPPPDIGGNTETAATYAAIRTTSFPASVTSIFLSDVYKAGFFVRSATALPDNGGTRIKDAAGQIWQRVYEERINAAWFYSGPPDSLGNPTTLGSGPVKITAADQAANPQWVGLADDGGTGVQTAQPYPIGTFWDFVCLQEWIYACAAERSVPQSTFIGSMNNDGRVHISQWLTGPQFLGIGQTITGAGVAPGTFVTAPTSDPNVYWVGASHNTGGLNITTSAGTAFRGWVEGTILTSSGSAFTGPLLQQGDELIDPLYPPQTFYNGVLPGTVVGPQIDGPPGGGLNVTADFQIGIKQNVPSTPMTGVGGPTWNSSGGQNYRNIPGYCPRGVCYLNQMLVCDGQGLDLFFASKQGTVLYWYGTATGTSNVGPGFKFNTLSYSVVRSLSMVDQSTGGVSNYLISISHTGINDPGLNVQNNTFHDWIIAGNYASSKCGVAISPEGGAAQGDSQTFLACFVFGFDDGFTFGGANAIAGAFFAGQTQSCPRYGVGAFGGSFSAYTMITENNAVAYNYYATPPRSQLHMGGADFFASQVSSESCLSVGTRSEAWVGMIDLNHESSMINWTSGGFFGAWQPNMHWTPQTIMGLANTKVGSINPLGNYTTVMMVDDGGPPWFQGAIDATGTVITVTPSPGWTPNQWANWGIWLLTGRASTSQGILSNTANTITLSSPVNASGSPWWKIFGQSAGAPPNWSAVTSFGQFRRNATGWGATIAAGFNLVSSASIGGTIGAGSWVMLPDLAVFPDGQNVAMALVGKLQNQHPGSTGWYMQTAGTTATIWGAPSNPILLGTYGIGFNPFIGQLSGPTGGVGTYQLRYNSNIGANFTGSITGQFLSVSAVQSGTLGANYFLGGAGLATAPAPQIAAPGVVFIGFIDDGTGGNVAGNILTVQSVVGPGLIRLGTPVTGAAVAAGSVITDQISGPAGGAGTYHVYAGGQSQLVGAASFTGSLNTLGYLNVSAVAAGTLTAGQVVQGAGIAANTIITSQTSGTTGGIGQYTINIPQNVASEALTASWNLAAGGQAAQFTGHVDDGNTPAGLGALLTVTATAGGVLGVGETVNVPVTGGPAGLTQQATIVAGLNDTGTGGVGTYSLSGLGKVIVPSSPMTANTTNGIGVYALTAPVGAPVTNEAMQAGVAGSTAAVWEIVDSHGNPQLATKDATDGFGYLSAGIADGNLTWMVIDWDSMWGVGALDQCQLGGLGKVQQIGRIDNPGAPTFLPGQFIRPGEGAGNQFSYANSVTYSPSPGYGTSVSTTPFTIPTTVFGSANVFAYVYQNTTLGLAKLGPGTIVDIDLILQAQANISGGMVITWDPTTVRAAAPTLNLGQSPLNTVIRMKWVGNGNAAAPGGAWWVMSVQGPM